MKIITLKILRWFTTVIALILSIDALLAIYKTVSFRYGIDTILDFYAILLVCLVLLVVTVLTGFGALPRSLKRGFPLAERAILATATGIGIVFLSMNFFSFSEWINQALASKSESVLVCVALSCVLMSLTWSEE
jgi:hypothetical protein